MPQGERQGLVASKGTRYPVSFLCAPFDEIASTSEHFSALASLLFGPNKLEELALTCSAPLMTSNPSRQSDEGNNSGTATETR